jgi:hypothetical protein
VIHLFCLSEDYVIVFCNRVLTFLFVGSNEREFGQWMWRITFLSNFSASLISFSYSVSEVLSDLYILHLINTTLQLLWWLCFFGCLVLGPSFVNDSTKSAVDGGKYKLHSYDAALELIGSGILVDSSSYPVVCHTCRVQRPLRSKHCRAARRCVHKFDHFW